MALFDEHRDVHVAPEDAIVIVHRFVEKCRRWALEREIPPRSQRVAAERDPTAAAKLHAWCAYAQFMEHTLKELEEGTLDHWFGGQDPAKDVPEPPRTA